jgi:hypothetical protein
MPDGSDKIRFGRAHHISRHAAALPHHTHNEMLRPPLPQACLATNRDLLMEPFQLEELAHQLEHGQADLPAGVDRRLLAEYEAK